MDKKHYPTAFLLVIALAMYFMYGDEFSLKQVDFPTYKQYCDDYLNAKVGVHSDKDILSLVNKINYLLPEPLAEIEDPLKKEIKLCAIELAKRINSN